MKREELIMKMGVILLKRRDALRRSVAGDLAVLGRAHELRPVGDECDEALDGVGDELLSQLAQTESRELTAIEAALARLRAGQYGRCAQCGGKIVMARLMALPYATHCIKCQRDREREGVLGTAAISDWSGVLDSSADQESPSLEAAEFMLS